MRLVIFFEKIHQSASQENEEPTPKRGKKCQEKICQIETFLNFNSPTCSLKCHKTGETPNPKFENSCMLVMEVA